ncbi:hypothetical protein WN55_07977 [Dufourea novaeangliae]|uniref:Uncharacterized protein n=1 Tax=Dufourea novaeangliae TaxID=178035 RepID=A0A154P5X8_DUFNO|nr:hypothetical protein WN55_07977 [Dufourea novaeangliae]
MAGCSALVVSRSAQVASTRSPYGLTYADTASSRLFHVRAPRSYPVCRVQPVGRELTAATKLQEDHEEVGTI